MSDPSFWSCKKVLITGHTGFKGSWLVIWLAKLGARVYGVGLEPNTDPSLYDLAGVGDLCESIYCDIRDEEELSKIVKRIQPEIIFHLAAQSLVRASYTDPLRTFSTNVIGTANVLNSLRGLDSLRAVVMVTTDKVYRNENSNRPFRESDPLGGYDPYSASKAASELVISSYRDSFFENSNVGIAVVRAGNVIGGGDWAGDRLIPDAIRVWSNGEPLILRRADAVRPWQHVLEPLSVYLTLAERLWFDKQLSSAFNIGPEAEDSIPVLDLIKLASQAFGHGDFSVSYQEEGPHEAALLMLENTKIKEQLFYSPVWRLGKAVKRTMLWYKKQLEGSDSLQLCIKDIEDYEEHRRTL